MGSGTHRCAILSSSVEKLRPWGLRHASWVMTPHGGLFCSLPQTLSQSTLEAPRGGRGGDASTSLKSAS